ncbi:XRE family transcriptional regulator [Vibrio harveyi]|uniref:XRE family transcriptional regulator n=1 Tax=Vibrio harveyi TaxID=669 RepID=UPI001EFD43E8|nr:XRE family transcriptional regulator [Vibrio harveyi]MCG9612848.1 XRE family transcriptional regulator [Vibrio harveyi]MCG9671325.1 XRE family transcriptional regulator [Vibrio harveyi]
MQTIADRIKALRLREKLTQKELGEKVGVTSVTISKWELDTAKPKSNSLLKLCKIFNVDAEWLTNGRSLGTTFGILHTKQDELLKVPFFEDIEAAAGNGCTVFNEYADLELVIPKSFFNTVVSSELICLRILGDSMEPEFKDGAIICIDAQKTKPIDGKTYVVKHDGMLRVKYIENTPQGIVLKSYNTSYAEVLVTSNESFCIIGAVVMQLSFYK